MAILVTEQSPNSTQQDDLIRFLELHPVYYTIMKSSLCIRILESLAQKAKNILMLKRDFPKIEQQDIVLLLESLIEAGVVSFFDAGTQRFYYTNKNGRQFLEIYKRTKERFLGKEESF